jgi:hypothetical protein
VPISVAPTEHDGHAVPVSETHKIACFVRVDLVIQGRPSTDLYDEVSERVQDLLLEALLSPQSAYDPLGMTCRMAGPLGDADELGMGEVGDEFGPLLSVPSDDRAQDE